MDQLTSVKPFYQHLLIGESTADVDCRCAATFGSHWHSEIEILYYYQGSGTMTVTIDQTPFTMVAGTAIFISSTAVHSITQVDPQCQLLYIKVGHALLGRDYGVFAGKRFSNPLLRLDTGEHPELLRLFNQLIQTFQESTQKQEDVQKLTVNACLYQIAAVMAERLPMTAISQQRVRQLEAVMAIQTVLTHIEDAYPHPITLEYAATLAGYEKTRFCQLFKQAVGVSFYKYLTDRRLQAAVNMLQETNLPISAIGEAVGILQPKTFSRLIRQNYGKTPSELRAEHSEKNT